MAKCLVTKLNGSVDNNELLRLGEMRIKVESVESPTKDTQGFGVSFTKPTTVEIVGDGYFTDNTLTENKGKSMVVSSLQGVIVSQATTVAIRNKYKLTNLNVYIPSGNPYGKNKVLNIDDLKYSTSLISLNLSNVQASGNIANLKNLVALTTLNISSTNISGDIANLKNLTALTKLSIAKSNISGDITNIYFVLRGTIKEFSVAYCNYLSGDLASLPNNILFFNSESSNSKFTWTKGSSRTNILACGHLYCTNIDDMLNDMADKTASFAGKDAYYKVISLVGTRTSASDAAVATLQSKGYTVSVIPA